MKKILLSSLFAICLISSCGKKYIAPETDSGKEYDVIFKTGFSQTRTELPGNMAKLQSNGVSKSSGSSTQLSYHITHFQYLLINEKEETIASHIEYRKEDPDKPGEYLEFEMPSAKLSSGKYRVIFFGATGSQLLWSHEWTGLTTNNPATDAFLSVNDFVVSDKDIEVEASLKRIGGKLKIVIEDKWPEEVERIDALIRAPKYYYFPKDEVSSDQNWLTVNKADGMSPEQFILVPSGLPLVFDSKIIAYGKYNEELFSKEIKQVVIERNKITILRGSLFDKPDNTGKASKFSVSIESGKLSETEQRF